MSSYIFELIVYLSLIHLNDSVVVH